jgi:hypothetical protein
MNPATTLLILRIAGALLLLSFLGAIVYFIYRDIQLASSPDVRPAKPKGLLRAISSDSNPALEGHEYSLSIVNGIGRAPENLIVLEDEFTSSRHALIMWSDEKWLVEDLGSRNGTLLNDLPLESQTVIVAGDILTVGRTKFKLEI